MSERHKLNNLKTNILNKFLLFGKFSGQGFTLIELLLAAFLSFLVIGGASFVVMRVLEISGKEEELNVRQQNLQRALDFIALETEQANAIVDPSTVIFTEASSASNVKRVIALTIPNNSSGNDYEVVYYIAQPPSNSLWSGQRVIYRWGPGIDSDGDYTSTNSNSVLIDFISAQSPNEDNCPASWDAYPPQNQRLGFYACVTDGAIALVYLEGEKDKADDYARVESKIFARLASSSP